MSSCVLQLRETSSDRLHTKIKIIELVIYSDEFVPTRSTVFSSSLLLCKSLFNNLYNFLKTVIEFTFVKTIAIMKTLRLYLGTIFFLQYPFKSKKNNPELFHITKFKEKIFSTKLRSKLEIASLVKEESTIVASPFTFKTTNVCFSLR